VSADPLRLFAIDARPRPICRSARGHRRRDRAFCAGGPFARPIVRGSGDRPVADVMWRRTGRDGVIWFRRDGDYGRVLVQCVVDGVVALAGLGHRPAGRRAAGLPRGPHGE